MQIETFKVYKDLVDSKSFSKAASLNFVTQSAVSQQLRGLEERFKTPLIERSSRHFGMTREGEMLYEAAIRMIAEYDTIVHQLEESSQVISGQVRISTVYSIGLYELPPYLKFFLKEFPAVNVHIEYRRSNQVYDDIIDGSSDIGLVAYPVARKIIKIETFRKDRLVLVCSPHHPLAPNGVVSLKEIAKEKFIGFEPDIPTRKAIDKMFKEAEVEVNPVMEFDNIETVKRAVEIEAGVSIVPRATIEQEVRNGTLVALEFSGQQFQRPLGIIYKTGRVLSPAMKRFIKLLHEDEKTRSS